MELVGKFCVVVVLTICLQPGSLWAHKRNATEYYLTDNKNFTSYAGSPCDESSDYAVCSTGSRLYQLLSYEVAEPQILHKCFESCNDSYSTSENVAICKEGCINQVPFTQQKQKMLAKYDPTDMLIRRALRQQMISHWMFSMIAGIDPFNDWYNSAPEKDNSDGEYSTYVVVEQSNQQLRISSYHIINGMPKTTTDVDDSGPLNPYNEMDDSDANSCYSSSTYSRFALCILLFSSAWFLMWLICSTVTTAPRQPVENSQAKDNTKAVMLMVDDSPAAVHKCTKSDDVKMILA